MAMSAIVRARPMRSTSMRRAAHKRTGMALATAYHTTEPTPNDQSNAERSGGGPGRRGSDRIPGATPGKPGGLAYLPSATAPTAAAIQSSTVGHRDAESSR